MEAAPCTNIYHPGHQSRLTHSGLINQVRSLQCPICYKFMTEPKLLKCGHTFCLACLSTIVNANKISCALCRAFTEITNGNPATLPSNHAFRSVVEEVANLEGRCDVCDTLGNSDEISYCQDCNIFICPDCLVKHEGKTENDNHSVKKTRRSKHFSMGNKFCTKHIRNACEGICIACNVYICKECSLTHKNEGHEVQGLVQYATNLHATAIPLRNDIKSIRKVSESRVEQCEYHKDKTVRHIDWVMSQIHDEYQASLKKIEEKRFSIIKACSDLKGRMCKVSEDLIEEMEKCNSILDEANFSIQGVLDSPFGDILEHNSALQSSQSKIKDLKKEMSHNKYPIVSNAFKDGDTLNFQKKCEDYDVVELTRHVWERTSRLLTQSEKKMTCMTLDCEGKVVVGYFHGGIEVFTGTRSEGVSVESLKKVRVMAMSFGNDGNLVLRNIFNEISIYGRKLKKYDAKFETIDHTKGGDGDLALDTNNDIYASYRTIRVIHKYSKQGGKAWQEIKCVGFIPQQILVMSNLDIIVMDAATIRILNKSGVTKLTVGRKGYIGCPAVAWDGTFIIAWVKHGGQSVELVKYTQDKKHKKTLHLDNTIDLSGREWYYCRVVDAEKIVFCCPTQVHIYRLDTRRYSSQHHEDKSADRIPDNWVWV